MYYCYALTSTICRKTLQVKLVSCRKTLQLPIQITTIVLTNLQTSNAAFWKHRHTLFAEKVCKLTVLFAVNVCNVTITNVLFGV